MRACSRPSGAATSCAATGTPRDDDAGAALRRPAGPGEERAAGVARFDAVCARRPDARMVVVGDGPLRRSLQASHPHVHFVGMQRGSALAAHYASADVFLFPSLSETFGNVTLEALATGLRGGRLRCRCRRRIDARRPQRPAGAARRRDGFVRRAPAGAAADPRPRARCARERAADRAGAATGSRCCTASSSGWPNWRSRRKFRPCKSGLNARARAGSSATGAGRTRCIASPTGRPVMLSLVLASRLGDGPLWYAADRAAAAGRRAGRHRVRAADGWCRAAQPGDLPLVKRRTCRPRPFVSCPGIRACTHAARRLQLSQRPHAACGGLRHRAGLPLSAAAWLVGPFALLVAASRMVLGLHYPSDVPVGAAIGVGAHRAAGD